MQRMLESLEQDALEADRRRRAQYSCILRTLRPERARQPVGESAQHAAVTGKGVAVLDEKALARLIDAATAASPPQNARAPSLPASPPQMLPMMPTEHMAVEHTAQQAEHMAALGPAAPRAERVGALRRATEQGAASWHDALQLHTAATAAAIRQSRPPAPARPGRASSPPVLPCADSPRAEARDVVALETAVSAAAADDFSREAAAGAVAAHGASHSAAAAECGVVTSCTRDLSESGVTTPPSRSSGRHTSPGPSSCSPSHCSASLIPPPCAARVPLGVAPPRALVQAFGEGDLRAAPDSAVAADCGGASVGEPGEGEDSAADPGGGIATDDGARPARAAILRLCDGAAPATLGTDPAMPLAGVAADGAAGGGMPFVASTRVAAMQRTIAQQRAALLFSRRAWWYKPVAMLGGRCYSIQEGESVHFTLGKRMLVDHLQPSLTRPKCGFMVYDCAARALKSTAGQRKGRLAAAQIGVLRVRARQPCAPVDAMWPTPSGVWAFRVIVPVAVALEQQTWMEEVPGASTWCPATLAGHCEQCAMRDVTCVQVRDALSPRAPRLACVRLDRPSLPAPGARSAQARRVSEGAGVSPTAPSGPMDWRHTPTAEERAPTETRAAGPVRAWPQLLRLSDWGPTRASSSGCVLRSARPDKTPDRTAQRDHARLYTSEARAVIYVKQ